MLRVALTRLLPAAVCLALGAGSAAAQSGSGAPAGAAGERAAAERALDRAEDIRAAGARSGRELTLALQELALRLRALEGPSRREGERLLARPTDGPGPAGDGYTVPEAPGSPYCTAAFCVHWVASSEDAPSPADSDADGAPDYVEAVAAELERSRAVENGQLGWREPVSDGSRGGGADKVDAYLEEMPSGTFGYAAIDPGQSGPSRYGYLSLDNDYRADQFRGRNPLSSLRATAAHEYNHLLQYAYDTFQDTWMLESTAVWMEEQVYDEVNDYRNYLRRWGELTEVPLTSFELREPRSPNNIKVYGSAVWNLWLSERLGPEVVRDAWASSRATFPPSFAPAAYDAGIAGRAGRGFFDEFTRFAAAVAEWRAPGAGFSEGGAFPDVERLGIMQPDGPVVSPVLDHTTFALYHVPSTSGAGVKLLAAVPSGTAGAIALVGRTGDGAGATVSVSFLPLPEGGFGSVSLPDPGRFSRITAVLVNADTDQTGFCAGRLPPECRDTETLDWAWIADRQTVPARISTDVAPPTVAASSPAAGSRSAPTSGNVSITFSEPVSGVDGNSVILEGPDGRALPAQVSYDPVTLRATLDPLAELADTTPYAVRLRSSIRDESDNAMVETVLRFTTVRRLPVVSLSAASRQRSSDVLRRGLSALLRSADRDRLSYSVDVDASSRDIGLRGRRTLVARARGSLAPRRSTGLRLRLSRAAAGTLRRGRSLRLRVVLRATDPQRNTRRIERTVIVRR